MEWDKLIKDLRKKMLVSQEEMADKLGIVFCTLNRYENGHHEPSYKLQRKIRALAIANGIDWDKYEKGTK